MRMKRIAGLTLAFLLALAVGWQLNLLAAGTSGVFYDDIGTGNHPCQDARYADEYCNLSTGWCEDSEEAGGCDQYGEVIPNEPPTCKHSCMDDRQGC
jgi:hypothetical protein